MPLQRPRVRERCGVWKFNIFFQNIARCVLFVILHMSWKLYRGIGLQFGVVYLFICLFYEGEGRRYICLKLLAGNWKIRWRLMILRKINIKTLYGSYSNNALYSFCQRFSVFITRAVLVPQHHRSHHPDDQNVTTTSRLAPTWQPLSGHQALTHTNTRPIITSNTTVITTYAAWRALTTTATTITTNLASIALANHTVTILSPPVTNTVTTSTTTLSPQLPRIYPATTTPHSIPQVCHRA